MPDISILSDMLFAVINLIEASSHATGSYMADKNPKWLSVKKEIDEIRKKYMERIVKEEDNQNWCFSKHIMSSFMRLIECGDKYLRNEETKKSEECYEDAKKLLEIFYKLNFVEEKKSFLQKLKGGKNGET